MNRCSSRARRNACSFVCLTWRACGSMWSERSTFYGWCWSAISWERIDASTCVIIAAHINSSADRACSSSVGTIVCSSAISLCNSRTSGFFSASTSSESAAICWSAVSSNFGILGTTIFTGAICRDVSPSAVIICCSAQILFVIKERAGGFSCNKASEHAQSNQ